LLLPPAADDASSGLDKAPVGLLEHPSNQPVAIKTRLTGHMRKVVIAL
jgi:hypothetical protein